MPLHGVDSDFSFYLHVISENRTQAYLDRGKIIVMKSKLKYISLCCRVGLVSVSQQMASKEFAHFPDNYVCNM
jgi:hypothetical protein